MTVKEMIQFAFANKLPGVSHATSRQVMVPLLIN
jgi:hypothetical protein